MLKIRIFRSVYLHSVSTTKFTDSLQQSDLDYKGWPYITKLGLGLNGHPKSACPIHPIEGRYFTGERAGVCTEILQRLFSTFSLRDFIQRGAAEAKKYLRCAF